MLRMHPASTHALEVRAKALSHCGPGWLGTQRSSCLCLPRVCVTMNVVGWQTRGAYPWELKLPMVVGASNQTWIL